MNAVSDRSCTMDKLWVLISQKQLKPNIWMKKFVSDDKKHTGHHYLLN